jgi:hypothetical protein
MARFSDILYSAYRTREPGDANMMTVWQCLVLFAIAHSQ